jgi:ssDNA-binding Zn-finger/Zn-ribbon topoisomerase 1
MTITISGTCPSCGHALKVCQARAGAFYLGCSDYPRCTFRCAYDATLQQLRDRNARLEAELVLLRMQHPSPANTERTGTLTSWANVAQRWGVQL